jgi:UDP-sugar pyrophosphorylase
MKQGKVPALMNNKADIASAGTYKVDAKPHGHGDVHSLMHSTGTAKNWENNGIYMYVRTCKCICV